MTSALAHAFVLGGKNTVRPVPIGVGEYKISLRSLRFAAVLASLVLSVCIACQPEAARALPVVLTTMFYMRVRFLYIRDNAAS